MEACTGQKHSNALFFVAKGFSYREFLVLSQLNDVVDVDLSTMLKIVFNVQRPT